MVEMTRRRFMGLSVKLAAIMGLSSSAVPQIAEALEQLSQNQAPVLWLQALSCSGCSVSLLNSGDPAPYQVLTKYISLRFHSTLSAATGGVAMEVLHSTQKKGDYYLVVEGCIAKKMPESCRMGDELVSEQVANAARKAKAVLAAGTCAAFGGIPAAENNPTGAMSVPDFLKDQNISVPVIRLPGCPVHPDWLLGTLVHVLKFGMPKLDGAGRPALFFSKLVHDQCPRLDDFEQEKFAESFSGEGCLFGLGCVGQETEADCPARQWNGGTNDCIRSGSPCIGCASKKFALKKDSPFFLKQEEKRAGQK